MQSNPVTMLLKIRMTATTTKYIGSEVELAA